MSVDRRVCNRCGHGADSHGRDECGECLPGQRCYPKKVMPRAYLVTLPSEFVVIASDERDVRDWAAEAAGDGLQRRILSADELAKFGETYPLGSWDPDRELTCAEIAAEMEPAAPRGDEEGGDRG